MNYPAYPLTNGSSDNLRYYRGVVDFYSATIALMEAAAYETAFDDPAADVIDAAIEALYARRESAEETVERLEPLAEYERSYDDWYDREEQLGRDEPRGAYDD
jgi:hypothetical protein